MNEIRDREFHRVIDRGGSAVADCRFVNCQFVNGGFSLTNDISNMSTAQNLVFESCHVCDSDIGPSILEDIQIIDLSTDDLLISWSPFLRHVEFRGRNGGVKINSAYTCVDYDPAIQQEVLVKRDRFYEETDWAIDISAAYFNDIDIEGIPVDLIRRDPSRQFVVTRNRALQEDWRFKVRCKNDFWVWMIDQFIKDGEPGKLLVVPEEGSRSEQRELSSALDELRELGVVT